MEATPEDMSICPGIGEQKVINGLNNKNNKKIIIKYSVFIQVKKIQDAFEQPFSVLKKLNSSSKHKEKEIVLNDEQDIL